MKFQLVILSALLACAFALPVPDEEVSPVKPVALPEIKTDVVPKPEEKVVEVVQPRAAAEPAFEAAAAAASAPVDAIVPTPNQEKRIELPLNTPDAELAQAIPEKKEQKKSEKQIAGLNKDEAKPLVDAVVAAPVEEKKPIAEVAEAVPVGKSADIEAAPVQPSEQKVEALSQETPAVKTAASPAVAAAAAEEVIEGKSAPVEAVQAILSEQKVEALAQDTPAVKSTAVEAAPVVAAAAPVAEEVKEEIPARQERNSESQQAAESVAAPVEAVKIVEAVSVTAAEPQPEVKTLPAEPLVLATSSASAAAVTDIAEPVPETKAQIKAEEPKLIAAGDIPQQSGEESKTRALPADKEESKPEAPPAEVAPVAAVVAAPEAKKIEETVAPLAEKPLEPKPIVEASAPQLKIEEAASSSDEKKSEESKESKESDESKESGESKEDKSE